MKTFFKHLLIDYKIGIREQTILLMNYLFPIVFFLFMGAVMGQVNPNYNSYLLPSMMMFSILTSTVLIAPNIVVGNRENGIYRSFKIYGVSKLSIMMLTIVSNLISVIVVNIVIIIISKYVFQVVMPTNFLSLIIIGFLFWFASITIAIFLGIICKNSKHTVMFSQLIFLPSILLGGVMIQLKDLPKSMSLISNILPSAHASNLFEVWSYNREGIANSYINIIALLIFGIAFFLIDLIIFKYDQ